MERATRSLPHLIQRGKQDLHHKGNQKEVDCHEIHFLCVLAMYQKVSLITILHHNQLKLPIRSSGKEHQCNNNKKDYLERHLVERVQWSTKDLFAHCILCNPGSYFRVSMNLQLSWFNSQGPIFRVGLIFDNHMRIQFSVWTLLFSHSGLFLRVLKCNAEHWS